MDINPSGGQKHDCSLSVRGVMRNLFANMFAMMTFFYSNSMSMVCS